MFGYGRLRPAIETIADAQQGAGATDAAARKPRGRNRINCVHLECELGEVVNLSLSGMRVRCHKKVSPPPPSMQPIRVTLRVEEGDDTLSVVLNARVAWSKRGGVAGLGRWEVGLYFEGVDDALAMRLSRLASASSDCEVVRPRA